MLPAGQFEGSLQKLFCPGQIRLWCGHQDRRLDTQQLRQADSLPVGLDPGNRVIDGNHGRISLAGLREAFRQNAEKCRIVQLVAISPQRINGVTQQLNASLGFTVMDRQCALQAKADPMMGAQGMLFGMGNQKLDQVLCNGNIPNPYKHEPREDEASGECGGMLYSCLLLDRVSRHPRCLVGETPKPSDRRQGATNSHLGMTIESEIS